MTKTSQDYDQAYTEWLAAHIMLTTAHDEGWDRYDAPDWQRREVEKANTRERKASRKLKEASRNWAQSVGWE